jgi:hypothetical protein
MSLYDLLLQALNIILAVGIGLIVTYLILKLLSLVQTRVSINQTIIHTKEMFLIDKIGSLIDAQIELSIGKYYTPRRAMDQIAKRTTIQKAEVVFLIQQVTDHFYASLPKKFVEEILFEYISSQQISYLITTMFIDTINTYYRVIDDNEGDTTGTEGS